LFLKIRSKSIGETADFTLSCGECGKTTPYLLKLDEVEVKGLENQPDKFIKINEEIGVKLKWPTALVAAEVDTLTDDELVARCIDYIVDGEETFGVENETPEEIGSFVENLPINVMDKMRTFFQQMPRIEHTVEYNCPHCEHDNNISINGYEHFFG
jgi:hypothetical protein